MSEFRDPFEFRDPSTQDFRDPATFVEPDAPKRPFLTGIVRGIRDPLEKTEQIFLRGVEAILPEGRAKEFISGGRQQAEERFKQTQAEYEASGRVPDFDVARLLGGVVPGTVALGGIPAAGANMATRLPFSGLTGALLSGIATPVSEKEIEEKGFGRALAEQAAIGGALGVATPLVMSGMSKALQKVIKPKAATVPGQQQATQAAAQQIAPLPPRAAGFQQVAPRQIAYAPPHTEPLAGKAGNINLERINTIDDIKNVISQTSNMFGGFDAQRRGVVSHENLKVLARSTGLSEEKLMKMAPGEILNPEGGLAARAILVQSANSTRQLAQQAHQNPALLPELEKALTKHAAIQRAVAGQAAEAGRLLNMFKIGVDEDLASFITSRRGQSIQQVAKLIATQPPGNLNINQLARNSTKADFQEKLQEYFINSLLSGPRTHAVNVLSNTMTASILAVERPIAGMLGKLHGGDKVYLRETPMYLHGMMHGALEGLKAGFETLRTGIPAGRFSPESSKLEILARQAIPGKAGAIVRTPGRFLTAEDEFFKAVTGRAELHALAMRKAIKEGAKNVWQRAIEIANAAPDDLMEEAQKAAVYTTFQKQLGPTGQKLQALSNANIATKILMPFVRTPANIVKFAGERTPFAALMPSVHEAVKKGGAARDQQLARLFFGTGVGALTVMAALDDKITGSGPSDFNERRILEATGWRPYSIKSGDTYYSYQRLEPAGILLGIAADAAKIWQHMEDPEAEKMAFMIARAIQENFSNKTFFQGLSSGVLAASDPQRYGSYFARLAGAFAVPTGVAHIAQTRDPTVRQVTAADETLTEAAGYLEQVKNQIKNRVPGLRETLPARLNVFGEPIEHPGGVGPDIVSPIFVSKEKHDPVFSEMARLKMKTQAPKAEGLTFDQHRQLQEAAGQQSRRILEQLIASPEWSRIPDEQKKQIITRTFARIRAVHRRRLQAEQLLSERGGVPVQTE